MTHGLTKEILERFLDLSNRLSSENLHCDGEISRAEAERKRKALLKEWADLEREVGHRVSEDEVYAALFERR
ncbi:hypothetical protein F6X40_17245 [Paraburkholderia sp. UCT31]|uniref:hypothetical protein n=1 Tax=Paraburkholderia sp. UCT31 TaxID=2615209 RepID=UPI0016567D3F|nr:hypothetical protein [Paraburkholderia sp. UCT31]MBC8738521.1 hypothetical protein [Paraburkholderia sp. UCT31]